MHRGRRRKHWWELVFRRGIDRDQPIAPTPVSPWLIDFAGSGSGPEAGAGEAEWLEDSRLEQLLIRPARGAFDERTEQAVAGIAVREFSARLRSRLSEQD